MAEQETKHDGELSSFSDLQEFTTPKMLAWCGHCLCEEGLQDYYKGNQQLPSAQLGELPCPTCQEPVSISEKGVCPLLNDFKANKSEEMFRMMTLRKRVPSNLCDICQSEKITVEASVFCSKCRLTYCSGCLVKHDKNPIFKDHKVFEKSLQDAITMELMCRAHKGEDGRYMCQTCKAVICNLCAIDHSEHAVVEIDEVFAQQQEDMRNLQTIIDDKVKHWHSVKADLEAQNKQIFRSREKIEYAIRENSPEMSATSQETELRDLRQNSTQELEPIEQKLEMVEFYIAMANSLQEYTQSLGQRNVIQVMAGQDELIQRMCTIAEADETANANEPSSLVEDHVAVEMGEPEEEGPPAAVIKNVVLVSGITDTTDGNALKVFFQSKRLSGGGVVDNIDFRKDKGEAVVTYFSEEEDAAKMLSIDKFELYGARVSVIPLSDTYDGLDRESSQPRAIQVEGIGMDTSEEFLELFFENRRKSGGGNIELIEYEIKQGTAVIIFKDADTASRVVEKESLTVNGTHIKTTLMTPPAYTPVVYVPVEENLVLVSGLSPKCTGDDLETFFSAEYTQSEIQRMTFSLQPGVAMLQFAHPPEFDHLRELCVTKPLRGRMLSVQRVPQSRTIQVHDIGDVTDEMLTLYFESDRSGGGKVTYAQVCQQDDYALVDFAQCSSVQGILAKANHNVFGENLQVTVYYECLGLIPPHHDTTMPVGPVPKDVPAESLGARVLNILGNFIFH